MSLLQMNAAGAIMILAITVIRALALERLPKCTFLVLWGVALARLLLPFSLPSPLSVYTLLGAQAVDAPTQAAPGLQLLPLVPAGQAAAGAEAASASPALSPWAMVWAAGTVLLALALTVIYWRCRREFRASLPVEAPFAARWLDRHRLRRPLTIRQCDRISTPLTYGLLRPVILVPKSADWSDEEAMSYVLTHEYVHVRRLDGAAKLVLAAALCLHWWNPLVWVMYVLANRDLELSCDEAVVREFGVETRAVYARTLIRMEENRSHRIPLVSHFSKNAIEERIRAIMKIRRTTVLTLALACLVVLGTGSVFATSPWTEDELVPLPTEPVTEEYLFAAYVDPDGDWIYCTWDDGETFSQVTAADAELFFPACGVGVWGTYGDVIDTIQRQGCPLVFTYGSTNPDATSDPEFTTAMALRQNAIREKIMEREPGFVPDPAVTQFEMRDGDTTYLVIMSAPESEADTSPVGSSPDAFPPEITWSSSTP